MPKRSALVDGEKGSYDTREAAAIAGLRAIKQTDTELGGGILYNPETKKYAYTQPVGDGRGYHFSAGVQVPQGWQLQGLYHTHPQGANSSVFSADDINMASQLKVPSYILPRADDHIRMFDPSSSAVNANRFDPTRTYANGSVVEEGPPIDPTPKAHPGTALMPVQGSSRSERASGPAASRQSSSTTTLIAIQGSMATPNPFQSAVSNGGIGYTPITGSPAITSGTDPLSSLASLVGTGLGIYNTSNAYSGLQNALNTIGPTNLQPWQLSGPGGMSTGYNPSTGQANIDLGSLNPAFSGFAGAAGTGSNAYNAGLPSALSGTALSTLNPSLSTLFGAYGNYGAGMGAANAQLGNLGDFNTNYSNLLNAQYAQLAPQIQQQAFGLQNTLFGNGVADSTGAASGALAAQNFGRGVGQAQSTAQLNAFQQALAQQNSAASNYSTLSNSASGILNNAFANFGNTNQLISGLNTAGLNNAATAAQGAGALNTVGLNNYNASLQTGVGQGQVRNGSLFPYASLASSLAGQQTGLGSIADALTRAGANGLNIPGLFNQGQSLYNGASNLFGGGVGTGMGMTGASPFTGATGATSVDWGIGAAAPDSGAGTLASGGVPDWLSGFGGDFSAAGGGAAGTGAGAGTAAAGAGDASVLSGTGLEGSMETGGTAAGSSGSGLSGLAAAWPAAVGVGGILGLNAIFNHNSAYTPYDVAKSLQSSARGLGTLARQYASGARTYGGGPNSQQIAQGLSAEQNDWNQMAQLGYTNPQALIKLLGPPRQGGGQSLSGTLKLS